MNAYRLARLLFVERGHRGHRGRRVGQRSVRDPSASGQLTHNVDSGENHFQTPASLGRR